MKTSLFFALLISLFATATYAGNTKMSAHTHKLAANEVSLANNYDTYTISTAEGNNFIEVSGETMLGDKLKDGTLLKTAKPSINDLKSTDRWQKWLISKQANGYFTIMNLNSGKYITASAGKSITQARANQTDAQYWQIIKTQGNYYKVINKGNGLVISNNSLPKDSALTQSAYTNSASQHWKLNAIEADSYRDDAVVGFFQRNLGSSAFDEGSSIPLYYSLNKGKVLWVTGDTFYNQVDAKGEFGCNLYFPYHNSALLQPADHSWDPEKTKNLISSDGPQIFHPADPKNLFWPGAGIEVGNKIYVHNIEVITGTLNTVNQYLGVITETGTNNISPVKVVAVPGMTGQTAIVYTVGMVNPGDGFIYAYGIGGYMAASVFVARFEPAAPTKWSFWDGKYWAAKPSVAAKAVVAKATTNNIAVGYVNGKFLLIDMDFGFTCDVTTRNMYSSVSANPTGPFINKKAIYTLPDYKQGHAPVYYNPTIHAEFKNGHNELLIAYCINFYNRNDAKNTTCLTPCSNPDGSEDPNDYRIKGIRVPYSLIGL
ncbi:Ricin-type beta-trefoil lectin domain-like [Mucilaginibacter mallensis]|uniref:Ricin-type beta-trefoil lectin domain-like n=1 Tax=Mucilaginibacter mallensis TaxID=652787 RepID=A0A1H1PT76_MUCMA|nr:RICIN domain-containing protein [Mucilaginibacter mallensis]SDS14360.1 Ricin-type beta-trefoil lectin domain-like [Mucilaginibacter mallensis]